MKQELSFKAMIEDAGGGGAFVTVPYDVGKTFGKKRVKVKAWIDGELYRGSLVRMGGAGHIPGIRKDIREAIGKQVGKWLRSYWKRIWSREPSPSHRM